jgi:kynureninase
MTYEPTLEHARRRDEADPLRHFRLRFALPRDTGVEPRNAGGEARHTDSEPLVYLCGHSLGLQPAGTRETVLQELDEWARLGVRGHERAHRPWIPYHENLTDGLAYLTGARHSEVVAMNSLTVNLHLMLASFYKPAGDRCKILIEAGSFPSDRHAVASQLLWRGIDPQQALIELAPRAGEDLVSEELIEECLEQHGAELALILWPGVQYRTGQAFDLARLAQAAHRHGCLLGLDLAHSIGNVPLSLHEHDADFAVWCSYKYLNGGPGAIGGCFVHERHADEPVRLAGWWGHDEATRFRMEPQFRPAAGAAGWQISNPPILSAAPLIASLEIFREARIERLREKSLELSGFLEFLLLRLTPQIRLITPRDPASRGCQLSLRVEGGSARGKRIHEMLDSCGVVCDWRDPDTIRVAPVPLYNRFEDVFRFVEQLTRALHAVP